ncbi:hypothetical protein D3C72_2586000 [compost metagenome]
MGWRVAAGLELALKRMIQEWESAEGRHPVGANSFAKQTVGLPGDFWGPLRAP